MAAKRTKASIARIVNEKRKGEAYTVKSKEYCFTCAKRTVHYFRRDGTGTVYVTCDECGEMEERRD